MPPGVKKNCEKVKKTKTAVFHLVFFGKFNFAISCCSSLPRKPSISLRCCKERMCPRTRHNSKRKSKNLATGLRRADFFDKGDPSICGKDWKKSKFIRVFFSNFPTDIFAPQIAEDRMCSIATFFSCLDFSLVWAVVAALNSWEQGREGCQAKGAREDRPINSHTHWVPLSRIEDHKLPKFLEVSMVWGAEAWLSWLWMGPIQKLPVDLSKTTCCGPLLWKVIRGTQYRTGSNDQMGMINARPWTQSRTAIWYPLPGHRNADVLLASMQVFSHLSSLSPRSVPLLRLRAAEWHAWHERVAMQISFNPSCYGKIGFQIQLQLFFLRESKVPIPPTRPRRTRGNKASLKLPWTTTLPSSNMAKLRRYFLGGGIGGVYPEIPLQSLH